VVVIRILPYRGPHGLLHAAPNSRQGDRGRLVEDIPRDEPGYTGIICLENSSRPAADGGKSAGLFHIYGLRRELHVHLRQSGVSR